MWYGMIRYASKHKENLGMLGSVVERLEALWKLLHAFRAFRERVRSFSRLGWLNSIKTYGMVGYVMYVCKHKQNKWERSRVFWNVLKRLGNF